MTITLNASLLYQKEFSITPIGLDGFVFFVNAENPVDSLATERLQEIYSGKITNWRDVGGANARIIPFQRYEGSGSQSRMERFMGSLPPIESTQEYRFKDMQGIIRHAARYHNYRNAIGYSLRKTPVQGIKHYAMPCGIRIPII